MVFLKRNRGIANIDNYRSKAVIYKARNSGEKPNASHMINLLRIEAEKEQLASRLKNKPELFEMKWKTLKRILSE